MLPDVKVFPVSESKTNVTSQRPVHFTELKFKNIYIYINLHNNKIKWWETAWTCMHDQTFNAKHYILY